MISNQTVADKFIQRLIAKTILVVAVLRYVVVIKGVCYLKSYQFARGSCRRDLHRTHLVLTSLFWFCQLKTNSIRRSNVMIYYCNQIE